jgi:hypothetical protein
LQFRQGLSDKEERMARSSQKRRRPRSDVDGFFAQPFEKILAVLTRPITEVLTDEQLKAHELKKELLTVMAANPRRVPPTNPMLPWVRYEYVWRTYREVVAGWRGHGRPHSQDLLLRALRTAFPGMAEDDLTTLSRSAVSKAESDSRAAVLGDYAGRPFGIGASAVRAAASQARKLDRRWGPFLRWIASARPELLLDMTMVANLLEWACGFGRTHPAAFYEVEGPAALDLLRRSRAPTAN